MMAGKRWKVLLAVAATLTLATILGIAMASGLKAGPQRTHRPHLHSSQLGFVLRPMPEARGCTPTQKLGGKDDPVVVRHALALLRTRRKADDGLPVLNRTDGRGSEDVGWLAVRSFDARGVRRAPVGPATGAYVVPSNAVLRLDAPRTGAACPEQLKAAMSPGACLTIGSTPGTFAVRCWTLAEIGAGRSLAVVGSGLKRRLVGLAADSHPRLRIRALGHTRAVVARSNVIYVKTHLGPGTRVVVMPR